MSLLAPGFSSEQAIATDNGALLAVRVRDYGTSLPIAFQYGRGSSLGTSTTAVMTGGTGSDTIIQAISGLSPSTRYSWRAYATDGTVDTAFGPTHTFTTEATSTTGPKGKAGKIEVVTCRQTHSHGVTVEQCTGKLVSTPVEVAAEQIRRRPAVARPAAVRHRRSPPRPERPDAAADRAPGPPALARVLHPADAHRADDGAAQLRLDSSVTIRSAASAARSTSASTSARRLTEAPEHVGGDEVGVGGRRAPDADPDAREVGRPEPLLERLQPVVPGQAATDAGPDLAEREVDLVVHDEHALERRP